MVELVAKASTEHTKGSVQVWRDCASLRIVLQSLLQEVNQSKGIKSESVPIINQIQESACRLVSQSASRVSKEFTSQECTWEALNQSNTLVMKYCLSEADVWHERTKVPGRKAMKVLDQSISSQMEYVMSDPDQRAVKRCRGVTEEEYDDAPLYAALLKESVQKGASGDEYKAMKTASKFGKRGAAKEVDRRASKGRKIRYTAIDKLTHFMAPRPVPLSEGIPITDEGLIEAFVSSIFQR